jgi:hypothetical protein
MYSERQPCADATICYAFMQAVGMVDGHSSSVPSCFCCFPYNFRYTTYVAEMEADLLHKQRHNKKSISHNGYAFRILGGTDGN